MRLFYMKEAPGQHAAATFEDDAGPAKTVALFRTERDARRFVDAGNRSMTIEEEKEARSKRAPAVHDTWSAQDHKEFDEAYSVAKAAIGITIDT